jgi:ABC-type glycerol-3-phosphate transport system permease component
MSNNVKTKKTDRKFSVLYLILGIVLAIYAISFLYVLFWALSTSLKDPIFDFEIDNYAGLPRALHFENYATVVNAFFVRISTDEGTRKVYFIEMLTNSVLFALGNSLVQVTVTFLMAYAAARFKFFIGKVIYSVVIVGMILPIVGSQPSALAVSRQLGLYNSILGMYVHKFTFLGMYFLVFHAVLGAYPKDFDEAAQIDGASNLSVMLRIMWPLSATTYFTVLLLVFIAQWNDYTTPMLFMPDVPTIAYGLRTFDASTDNDITNVPTRMAACLLGAIPTLALFVIFHDRLLNNVSLGGVKE